MKNKCLLLSISGPSNSFLEIFEELEQLCKTLNFEVVDKIFQKRLKPDPKYYIGIGKLEKINSLIENSQINCLVINDDLSPLQRKNIEKFLNIKVYDRTEIILEIFSKHAHTKEGKLQVEIARLNYLLPYLLGKGKELSRLGGGVGTRGPGEKELEYSKRYIKNRIKILKNNLKKLENNREIIRKKRFKSDTIKISIVGYTNAGKSTLLSKLTGEKIKSKNEMFTTLSTLSRKVKLPSGRIAIFTDTVGFIRNLHPKIIEAFHSTLEEIKYSDIILILLDSSDIEFEKKLETVLNTLESIVPYEKPYFMVFNKIDLIPNEHLNFLKTRFSEAVFISAYKNLNIDKLLLQVDKLIDKITKQVTIEIKNKYLHILYKYKHFINFKILDIQNENVLVKLSGPENLITKITKEANR
ncbi:MAG: GTPase [Thermosipho sp. (in: thermotogales)]|nr:GTPase [Thermosipho sp. (in: thermotogales)]MDN5324802.1 GTPase [Thermosipho sp. (in: thermotogales)]